MGRHMFSTRRESVHDQQKHQEWVHVEQNKPKRENVSKVGKIKD